jgi:type III secretion protein V
MYKPERAATATISRAGAGLPSDASQKAKQAKQNDSEFSITVPLLLEVATVIEKYVEPDLLDDRLIQVRQALYHDLGVPFPNISLPFNEKLSYGMHQILPRKCLYLR